LYGHIDYLNLLPFYQFLKRKKINLIKSYPKKINSLFEKKRVDAAFISSIRSKNKKCFDVGIVAKKEVRSVLVCKGYGKDKESETSNALAKILNIKGQVVIGDKALKQKNCIDLATAWYEKYKLPFVFARFCVNKNYKKYEKLINKFLKTKQKIPYFTLQKYAKKLGISTQEAKEYIEKIIYYKIQWREKKSLKLFLRKSNEFTRNRKITKNRQ